MKDNKRIKIKVEIKQVKISKDKVLILMKDMNLYDTLEKERTKKRLKTLYFASFAHNLMTPINVMMGVSESVLDGSYELDPILYDLL